MPIILRRIFKILNMFFMVPLFRLGLGAILVSPIAGYIMVLKVVGRKSGKVRYAPVNYAIHEGAIYCLSGGRKTSDWYKNLLVHPEIEVILPGGAIYGRVSEENDVETRRVVIRRVLKNAGFAGFFEGYNPWTISDEDLQPRIIDIPLLKISPIGIGNGAADPAGWLWICLLVLVLAVIALLIF